MSEIETGHESFSATDPIPHIPPPNGANMSPCFP